MGAYDLLKEYSDRQGWPPSAMLNILCDFVDSLGNKEGLEDFLVALEDFLIERAELEDRQCPEETVHEDDEDEEKDEGTVEKETN